MCGNIAITAFIVALWSLFIAVITEKHNQTVAGIFVIILGLSTITVLVAVTLGILNEVWGFW